MMIDRLSRDFQVLFLISFLNSLNSLIYSYQIKCIIKKNSCIKTNLMLVNNIINYYSLIKKNYK